VSVFHYLHSRVVEANVKCDLRVDHFVPHWSFPTAGRSVRLKDGMANSNATIWIHLCYTIILIQPCLQRKHAKIYSVYTAM